MLTCRELLQLDIFKQIQLVAGRQGLDNVVTWPYPKHTKVIAPWVQGGEFVMISGYEQDVDEGELLSLLDEAVSSALSGMLVEGGVNFKRLPDQVIERAEAVGMPLFFAPRVISFLDLCKDISSLILERQMAVKYTESLLDKIIAADGQGRQELLLLFQSFGVPTDALYQIVLFTLHEDSQQEVRDDFGDLKRLQTACVRRLEQEGCKAIARASLNSVAYLAYAPSALALDELRGHLERVEVRRGDGSAAPRISIAVSGRLEDISDIAQGFHQALFTAMLMGSGVLGGSIQRFDELSSYQLLFYVKDRTALRRFRDRHLRTLYEADQERSSQLLKTLRCYLSNGGNLLRTAQTLFIHRNTLQYRLDRIGQITGQDLNQTSVRQDFLNACLILDLDPFHPSAEEGALWR